MLGLEEDDDDPRAVELSSLSAIYPELQLTRDGEADLYTITLDVPVCPTKAVTVFFPATAAAAVVVNDEGNNAGSSSSSSSSSSSNSNSYSKVAAAPVDSHELAHLPPVRVEIVLGPAYPADEPPRFSVSTTPPWLPATTARRLEDDGPRLWEDMGRDTVTFTYVDHVVVAAEEVFGLLVDNDDDRGVLGLEVAAEHKIALLDHDIRERRAAFERETFGCGVCLDPKKGAACHRMLDCGHVFCRDCLQDFYNAAIKEGSVSLVRCLNPGCAKERERAAAAEEEATATATAAATTSARKRRKKQRRALLLSPSELLQIPLEHEVVKRYVALKYKTELESDKNTIYCPRPWCNGAARSKKHRKPDGLGGSTSAADSDSSDDDGGADGDAEGRGARPGGDAQGGEKAETTAATVTLTTTTGPLKDRLAICEDCSFAFCRTCKQSWHGEFIRCRPSNGELSEEDKASLAYMRHYTTPCPTCATPAQKTHGCNHMICSRCDTHFCYLCAAWLDPGNPYQHFNAALDGRKNSCFMRLWELEEGDGLEGNHVLPPRDGPVNVPPPAARGPGPGPAPGQGQGHGDAHAQREQQPRQNGVAPVAVAREGPLVLRIEGAAPAPHPPAPANANANANGLALGAVPPPVPVPPAGRGYAHDGPGLAHPRGGGGGGGGRGGGRGGAARGGGGGGGAAGRRRPAGNNAAGRGGGGVQRHNNNNNNNNAHGGRAAPAGGDAAVLDAAHEAWIRHFVQLALNDHEELLLAGEDMD